MRAFRPWFLSFVLLVVVAASCGTDDADDVATTTSNPTTEAPPATQPESTPSTVPSTTAAPATTGGTTDEPTSERDDAQTGIVNVGLAPVEGFFIEGFEVGLRFETSDGEVIDAMLWNDIVRSLDAPSVDDYYQHVHSQQVPAGEIVVLATVSIGAGPPPVVPDLRGPMQCQLAVEVPADGEVDVEVAFEQSNCLSVR